jgi:hypothetical protein
MRKILSDKSGDTSGLKIVMAIVIILAILIVSIVIIMKYSATGGNVGLGCNNEKFGYCGCFFRTHRCPDGYISKDQNSKLCPQDSATCTEDSYSQLLETTKTNAKKMSKEQQKTAYGTCCLGELPVSRTRLNGYEGATSAPDSSITAPGGSADSKTAPALPSTPAVVTVDWGAGSTAVDYRFDRNTNTWQYNGGFGWGNVGDMGALYAEQNRQLAAALVTKNEQQGYAHFRTLSAAGAQVSGVPS